MAQAQERRLARSRRPRQKVKKTRAQCQRLLWKQGDSTETVEGFVKFDQNRFL